MLSLQQQHQKNVATLYKFECLLIDGFNSLTINNDIYLYDGNVCAFFFLILKEHPRSLLQFLTFQ